MSVALLPSLAIGVGAFAAGELVFHVAKKEEIKAPESLYEILNKAKERNSQIKDIIPKLEDPELVSMVKEINETVTKIIHTVEKKPDKQKQATQFFSYYLPITVNILNRYDEIENQRLTDDESKKFMESSKNMVAKVNGAFKKQLSALYQSDIIDTDAEMKVFETMLKADGYNPDSDFDIK